MEPLLVDICRILHLILPYLDKENINCLYGKLFFFKKLFALSLFDFKFILFRERSLKKVIKHLGLVIGKVLCFICTYKVYILKNYLKCKFIPGEAL